MSSRHLKAIFFSALAVIAIGVGGCFRPGMGPAGQQWMTYTDPGAHAFTVEAPKGWQVAGGTQKITDRESREGVVMRSPDGAIQLFFGDPTLPMFAVPSESLASRGARTGSNYAVGPGLNLFVADYVPGQQFSAQWGAFRVGEACGQVAVESSRRLPEVADAADTLFRQLGMAGSVEAGDANFRCVLSNGAPAKGYALTATRLSPATTLNMWSVVNAVGFIAPADRVGEARALLAHVIESYRNDPAWLAKQPGVPANAEDLTVRSNAFIAQTIRAASTDTAPASAERPQPYTVASAPPAQSPAPGPAPAGMPYPPAGETYSAPYPAAASMSDAPPMDMSWAMRSQMANQAAGDAAVRNAFNSAYAMLARARADGHPVDGLLVSGNHPNDFTDGGWTDRSNRTTRAIEDHTLRATQGCTRLYEDAQGDRWYGC